ncbi:MAG: helix-turn-helix domain-containing protein [Methylobacter sp.]
MYFDEIGQEIKKARKSKKLTQERLGSLVRMSRATISGIENGTIPEIGIRKVISILDTLGLELLVRPKPPRPTLPELIKENEEAARQNSESECQRAKAALRKHKANKARSLVAVLGLAFPYDWSNRGGISDDALIINVLKRGIYEDICRICAYYGIEKVDSLAAVAFKDEPSLIYPRMIENIRKGFALDVEIEPPP